MNRKKILRIGAVGIVIGLLLLLIGLPRYFEAKEMIALGEDLGFGSSHHNAWTDNKEQAEWLVWPGAIMLVVSGIFTLIGFCMNKTDKANDLDVGNSKSTGGKLNELAALFEQGLIDKEEYEAKRKEIIEQI